MKLLRLPCSSLADGNFPNYDTGAKRYLFLPGIEWPIPEKLIQGRNEHPNNIRAALDYENEQPRKVYLAWVIVLYGC
jgi:hypothetical protein